MQLALTQTLPIDLARRLLERAKKMTFTPGGNGVRYEPTVTLGQVILLLPILGMVAFYAINKGDTADSARQQVSDLRTDMNKGFGNLAVQISGLPKQSAQLDQAIQQISELTARISQDETRISATDRAAYQASETASELAKMVDQLRQQMNAPVPLRTTR